MQYEQLPEKERHAREMEIMNAPASEIAKRMYDLEQKAEQNQEAAEEVSWSNYPDRMGGQFDPNLEENSWI